MMNKWMTSCVAAIFLVMVNWAWALNITVDGDISDWDPNHIYTDTDGDGAGTLEVHNWGFYCGSTTKSDPGYLYWFSEIREKADGVPDAYGFTQGTNDMYPALWIDVDHYCGPVTIPPPPIGWIPGDPVTWDPNLDIPSALAWFPGSMPSEWMSGGAPAIGIDICAELGANTAHWGEGYNYWGQGDYTGNQGSYITVGEPRWAVSGTHVEGRVPIDDLVVEVTSYPDYQAGNFRNGHVNGLWKIAHRAEGVTNGATWGIDATYPVYLPIIADGNDDGQTNLQDFQALSVNYNSTGLTIPGSWEMGDYNLDGKVDLKDFQFLSVTFLSNIYTMGPGGTSSIPEPLTVLLIALGALFLPRR